MIERREIGKYVVLIILGDMCIESADFRKERGMGREGDVGTIKQLINYTNISTTL